MEKEKERQRRENKIRNELIKMQKEGLDFVFDETPDTYIIRFKDKENKERIIHFMKMNGMLPVGEKMYKIEEVIKAILIYPESKDIKEAVLKFYKQKNN